MVPRSTDAMQATTVVTSNSNESNMQLKRNPRRLQMSRGNEKKANTAASPLKGIKLVDAASSVLIDALPKLVPESDSSESTHCIHSPSASLISLDNYEDACQEPGSSISVESLSFHEALEDSQVQKSSVTAKKSLSWGTVTRRRYPIIPGDHPDTYKGPPLTIDWNYVSESTCPLDEYEAKHPLRRQESDLRLGWMTRRKMLRGLEFTEEDMEESQNAARKGRKQRESTINRLRFQGLAEVQEKVLRKLGRTLHPKKTLQTKY